MNKEKLLRHFKVAFLTVAIAGAFWRCWDAKAMFEEGNPFSDFDDMVDALVFNDGVKQESLRTLSETIDEMKAQGKAPDKPTEVLTARVMQQWLRDCPKVLNDAGVSLPLTYGAPSAEKVWAYPYCSIVDYRKAPRNKNAKVVQILFWIVAERVFNKGADIFDKEFRKAMERRPRSRYGQAHPSDPAPCPAYCGGVATGGSPGRFDH